MRQPIERPAKFNACYGCGSANARGLALEFFREGDSVVADFTPAPEHGGYGTVLHGGVTATLIDEAFGWTIFGLLGKLGLTTTLTVSFHAPLTCGETCLVRGRVESQTGREARVRAEVLDPRGKLAAEGTGTLRFVSARAVERIGGFDGGSSETPEARSGRA
jgi:uncharacterized protein (TIGR00369 family)